MGTSGFFLKSQMRLPPAPRIVQCVRMTFPHCPSSQLGAALSCRVLFPGLPEPWGARRKLGSGGNAGISRGWVAASQVRLAWRWHSRAGPGSGSWQGHQRESGREQESVPRAGRERLALPGGGVRGCVSGTAGAFLWPSGAPGVFGRH